MQNRMRFSALPLGIEIAKSDLKTESGSTYKRQTFLFFPEREWGKCSRPKYLRSNLRKSVLLGEKIPVKRPLRYRPRKKFSDESARPGLLNKIFPGMDRRVKGVVFQNRRPFFYILLLLFLLNFLKYQYKKTIRIHQTTKRHDVMFLVSRRPLFMLFF